MKPLPPSFYNQCVLQLGPALLGKRLVTVIDNEVTAGIITETESYKAPEDRASHAYNMRRTKRNEAMYLPAGFTYVYLCYGIHPLFNVVCQAEGVPEAVLIRAIFPTTGYEIMQKRRKKQLSKETIAVGPANLTKSLGITMELNSHFMQNKPLWIEDTAISFPENQIEKLKRVGIDYAGEDANLLWRFRVKPYWIQKMLPQQK